MNLFELPPGNKPPTEISCVDEKILAVPLSDPAFETYHRLDDVPPHFLRSMDHFFRIYKELENKEVTSMGWQDRWVAEKIITGCIEAWRMKKG
ncbi:inorganic diphosphatase [bacterium]|nr:inorganic diphosphatase [bacterium]MBU1984822.1 inorganic diphosphatase [bacterium]